MYARLRSLFAPPGEGRSAPGKSTPEYTTTGTSVPPGPVTTAVSEAAGSPSEAKAIVAEAAGAVPAIVGCVITGLAEGVIIELPPFAIDIEFDEWIGAGTDSMIVDPPGRTEVCGRKVGETPAGCEPTRVTLPGRTDVYGGSGDKALAGSEIATVDPSRRIDV